MAQIPVSQVPAMTSANAPSGVVSASSFFGSTPAYYAFAPGVNGWLTNGTSSGYLQYQFTGALTITSYDIIPWSADNFPSRSPTAWTLQGSNDGSAWTTVDTQSFSSWVSGTSTHFTVASPGSYSYYKLNVTANGGNAFLGIRALGLNIDVTQADYQDRVNQVPGMTSNSAPSGVATASSNYSATPIYYAFAPGVAGWLTNGTSSGYLQYQFTGALTITSYDIIPWSIDNFPDRSPTAWTLQGSNDGSAWTTIDTRGFFFCWIYGTPAHFTVANPGSYSYYRLDITNNAGNAYTGIRALGLNIDATPSGNLDINQVPNMTSDTSPSGVASASSYATGNDAYRAFATGTHGWLSDGTNTGYLQYQFTAALTVTSYDIFPWVFDTFPWRSPNAWTLQGSNNGSTWTTIDTRTFLFWEAVVARKFIVASPGSYSYYRLNITSNGSAVHTAVRSLALDSAPAAASVFRISTLSGIGSGGPFFSNPLN